MVDDAAPIRALARLSLQRHDHEIHEVSDGAAALDACRSFLPDVILLDIELPGLSGLEILARLQWDPLLRQIPVVCMTGRTDSRDAVRALELGAHDYLRKPVHPDELCARVAAALRVATLSQALRAKNADLEILSRTDVLTGLSNRRDVESRLATELDLARRHGFELSVLMIDVDHFKVLNDTLGHAAGDVALVEIARCLRAGLRTSDVLGRWGGEEFLAVLPVTGPDGALDVAARLCRQVAGLFPVLGGAAVPVGVSIGVACSDSGADGLVDRADHALYAAKKAGRGRARLERARRV